VTAAERIEQAVTVVPRRAETIAAKAGTSLRWARRVLARMEKEQRARRDRFGCWLSERPEGQR
jgi:hypothetical protein